MTAAVEVEGVTRRFGATRVLAETDLTVETGERVALVGDNGAGKTTLLGIVAGLLRPSAGAVRVLGASPEDPRVRRHVGLLGHTPFLYPRLTAAENLRFWGGLYRVPGARERGAGLLKRLGVDPTDPRPAAAYSQGMRRRIGLACALLPDPELLLLDEPFAGLDASGADIVTGLVTEGGRAILVATHEPELAGTIATRILRLEHGRLQEESR